MYDIHKRDITFPSYDPCITYSIKYNDCIILHLSPIYESQDAKILLSNKVSTLAINACKKNFYNPQWIS